MDPEISVSGETPQLTLFSNKDPSRLYQEVAAFLAPYHDSSAGSHLFVVEGTLEKPLVGIRYPGRKQARRTDRIT